MIGVRGVMDNMVSINKDKNENEPRGMDDHLGKSQVLNHRWFLYQFNIRHKICWPDPLDRMSNCSSVRSVRSVATSNGSSRSHDFFVKLNPICLLLRSGSPITRLQQTIQETPIVTDNVSILGLVNRREKVRSRVINKENCLIFTADWMTSAWRVPKNS